MACRRRWSPCRPPQPAPPTPRAPRANEKRRLRQPPPWSRVLQRASFVRLADRPPEADLPVVNANVESAFGVVAHPCLVGNGRAFASIITERKHGSLAAFATVRQLAHIHCSSPPPVRHSEPARALARLTRSRPRSRDTPGQRPGRSRTRRRIHHAYPMAG